MKTSVNIYQFRDSFQECRPNNFTYEGLTVLFEYLEQYEEDTGEELELDIIALCCDFSEASWGEIADMYDIDLTDNEGEETLEDDEKAAIVREYLEDNGALVGEVAGGFVYRDF